MHSKGRARNPGRSEKCCSAERTITPQVRSKPLINNSDNLPPNCPRLPKSEPPGNLPFIVRRDHRIVAAFAKKAAAEEWAQMRSFNDESRFTVHTAAEVLFVFQDGEEVR